MSLNRKNIVTANPCGCFALVAVIVITTCIVWVDVNATNRLSQPNRHQVRMRPAQQSRSGEDKIAIDDSHPSWKRPSAISTLEKVTDDEVHDLDDDSTTTSCLAVIAPYSSCGKGLWLGVQRTAEDCMALVLSQPVSECSHRRFIFANLNDFNCKCVPPVETDCVVFASKFSSIYHIGPQQTDPKVPTLVLRKPQRPPGQPIVMASDSKLVIDDNVLLRMAAPLHRGDVESVGIVRQRATELYFDKAPPLLNACDGRSNTRFFGPSKWHWFADKPSSDALTHLIANSSLPIALNTGLNSNWGMFSRSRDLVSAYNSTAVKGLCNFFDVTTEIARARVPQDQDRSDTPTWQPLQDILDNPKVLFVLTSSSSRLYHPKIVLVPLGFDVPREDNAVDVSTITGGREILVYADHSGLESRTITVSCLQKQLGSKLVVPSQSISPEEHFAYLRKAKFILSMPGLGVDCYRNWEAIYSGCIPIVLAGEGLEGLMQGLPVLFVNDYFDVTVAMLETAHTDILSRVHTYDLSRLQQTWWNHWFDKIDNDPATSEEFLSQFRSVPSSSSSSSSSSISSSSSSSKYDRNYSYLFEQQTSRLDCPV